MGGQYEYVPFLIKLTNMGLLHQMAKNVEYRPPERALVLSKVQIDDWDAEEEEIAWRYAGDKRSTSINWFPLPRIRSCESSTMWLQVIPWTPTHTSQSITPEA